MCGIIGYTGGRPALPILLGGLGALEYRGYDSAGVSLQEEGLTTVKRAGRLSVLEAAVGERFRSAATCGIGHTRWATHGAPTDVNAHPHATPRLALVHNGIIENDREVEDFLREQGYTPVSETDTERAALLIDWHYTRQRDAKTAVFAALKQLRGAYALGIVFADVPGKIYAVCRDNPLIVAVTEEGGLIASDIPALLPHSRTYIRPADGVLCEIGAGEARFFTADGEEVFPLPQEVDWDVIQAQREGYPHFMLKEIGEEPQAIAKTLTHYLRDGLPFFGHALLDEAFAPDRVHIVACGTAMNAGLIGKYQMERLARTPAAVEQAGEFRYGDPVLGGNDLVLLLSQSGETADTLAALRYAKSRGVRTLAIVNVVGSSVAREADHVLYTPAGPEIAVASTKAYSVQCILLHLLAIRMALCKGLLTAAEARAQCAVLEKEVPAAVGRAWRKSDELCALAARLTDKSHLFYIGRGVDLPLCIEGSLKLKEISYIHSEAYAAGELKHGTISLIEKGTPVVALVTASGTAEKMISAIREVRARGAWVLLVTTEAIASNRHIPHDGCVFLPVETEGAAVYAAATALQLLAYHTAALKGLDVDKPRNLAKSVTVE